MPVFAVNESQNIFSKMTNVPLIVRLLASSVSVANRAGKIVRDVMSKGELGIVEKVHET